jgi:hypothetical protein
MINYPQSLTALVAVKTLGDVETSFVTSKKESD